MNWLAHTFLSENNINYQLGNILADPFKGKSWATAETAYQQGMAMHKRIDVFTDSHPIVSKSKSRLRHKGYLKGVVIDITYDYLLTKHWRQFANIELNDFLNSFYKRAQLASCHYPKAESMFVTRLTSHEVLNQYHSIDGLKNVLQRMDARLSDTIRRKESASEYIDIIEQKIYDLEDDFLQFFPQLHAEVATNLNVSLADHWRDKAIPNKAI